MKNVDAAFLTGSQQSFSALFRFCWREDETVIFVVNSF